MLKLMTFRDMQMQAIERVLQTMRGQQHTVDFWRLRINKYLCVKAQITNNQELGQLFKLFSRKLSKRVERLYQNDITFYRVV